MQQISAGLINFSMNAVLVNELNCSFCILKSHNRSCQAHLKHLKKCVSLTDTNLIRKLLVHFSGKTEKTKLHKYF